MKKNERNPQETKRKILDAALQEFCNNGPDGARVDKIVKEAGVNKRMVYHYFDNKEGLFDAVFQEQVDIIDSVLDQTPTDSTKDQLEHWLNNSNRVKGFLKLSSWIESSDSNKLMHEKIKAEHFKEAINLFRQMQEEGKLSEEVSPDLYLIGMMGLISFPILFPQLVKFIASKNPMSDKFKQEYIKAIKEML